MTEKRFCFGKNWANFVEKEFSEEKLLAAHDKLIRTLHVIDLTGRTFLDIGCGSGLHSLAALRAGAERVISFDYDEHSVATAQVLRDAYPSYSTKWEIMQGSVLDVDFIQGLPKADIVYSWGVLHHTGNMWQAIDNARIPLKENGIFFVALYTYLGYEDGTLVGNPSPEEWLEIKQHYNKSSALGKRVQEYIYVWRKFFARSFPNPLELWSAWGRYKKYVRNYVDNRGMSYWTDVRDWLGGWPMEFVKEMECIDYCKKNLGLTLLEMNTGKGNTEFLFRPELASNYWDDILERRVLRSLSGPFVHAGGNMFSCPAPAESGDFDAPAHPFLSRVCLLEDGIPLAFGHSFAQAVKELGRGRYCHEQSAFLFSTSDNTNPNENGRTYSWYLQKMK